MYKIEKRPSGFIITFSGFVGIDEIKTWKEESENIFKNDVSPNFGVIINMNGLKPLSADAQNILVEGQQLYKDGGMYRSAVILDSPILQMQFKRLGKRSGITDTERYIDASSVINPIDIAISWVKDGIDPDL